MGYPILKFVLKKKDSAFADSTSMLYWWGTPQPALYISSEKVVAGKGLNWERVNRPRLQGGVLGAFFLGGGLCVCSVKHLRHSLSSIRPILIRGRLSIPDSTCSALLHWHMWLWKGRTSTNNHNLLTLLGSFIPSIKCTILCPQWHSWCRY